MALQISIFLIILNTALIFQVIIASNPTYLDSRCSNSMMFNPNSTYQSDVDSVFRSLTSKAATNTAGSTTANDVYGLYLCRGDLTTVSCKDCVVAATVGLSRSYCPLMKVGVIWYTECMVRYSNESFFGKMVELPRVIIRNSGNVTGNKTRLSEVWGNTMNDLVVQAANSVTNETFFEKVEMITMIHTLRVFGQCTQDLIGKDCGKCLKIAVSQLRVGITGSVLQPSCNVWYEVYESNNSSSSSSNLKIMNQTGRKQLRREVMVATIVPVTSVLIAVLVLRLIARKSTNKFVDEDLKDFESLRYDFATLQHATNNFSDDNKLGRDRHEGQVYKGVLCDGKQVAVKRMNPNWRFKNEFLSAVKLQHRNLVILLGFCLDEDGMLLVYEYLPYALDRVLDQESNQQLEWSTRFQIINGIAKGVLYLHQDSRLRIIHHDLKSANVLLDEHMNPKISDFGLASIFQDDQEDLSGAVTGTIGYICPHYLSTGRFSTKSDVYSFGVLMLEIICGRNPFSLSYYPPYTSITDLAREKWFDGRGLEFVDEAIRDSCDINQVERCLHLGLLCVEKIIDHRPTMATVVLMLESQSVTLPMPEQPAYMLSQGEPDQSPSAPMLWTVNDVSISEIEPR